MTTTTRWSVTIEGEGEDATLTARTEREAWAAAERYARAGEYDEDGEVVVILRRDGEYHGSRPVSVRARV